MSITCCKQQYNDLHDKVGKVTRFYNIATRGDERNKSKMPQEIKTAFDSIAILYANLFGCKDYVVDKKLLEGGRVYAATLHGKGIAVLEGCFFNVDVAKKANGCIGACLQDLIDGIDGVLKAKSEELPEVKVDAVAEKPVNASEANKDGNPEVKVGLTDVLPEVKGSAVTKSNKPEEKTVKEPEEKVSLLKALFDKIRANKFSVYAIPVYLVALLAFILSIVFII